MVQKRTYQPTLAVVTSYQPGREYLQAGDTVECVGRLELHAMLQAPKLDAAVLAARHHHLLTKTAWSKYTIKLVLTCHLR